MQLEPQSLQHADAWSKVRTKKRMRDPQKDRRDLSDRFHDALVKVGWSSPDGNKSLTSLPKFWSDLKRSHFSVAQRTQIVTYTLTELSNVPHTANMFVFVNLRCICCKWSISWKDRKGGITYQSNAGVNQSGVAGWSTTLLSKELLYAQTLLGTHEAEVWKEDLSCSIPSLQRRNID